MLLMRTNSLQSMSKGTELGATQQQASGACYLEYRRLAALRYLVLPRQAALQLLASRRSAVRSIQVLQLPRLTYFRQALQMSPLSRKMKQIIRRSRQLKITINLRSLSTKAMFYLMSQLKFKMKQLGRISLESCGERFKLLELLQQLWLQLRQQLSHIRRALLLT